MIMSFLRPTMKQYPSSSIVPISPVWNQTSVRIAADVSGAFQYSRITCGPLRSSSPCVPEGTSVEGSSTLTTFTSVFGTGTPMLPILRRPFSGLACVTGDVSVRP